MRRVRILFVIPTMSGGGSEKVLLLLLRSLDRSKCEPLLLMTRGGGVFMKGLPPDVVAYNLDGSRSRYTTFQLVRKLWQIRPDVIMSMALHLTILLAILRPFLPRHIRLCARQNTNTTAHLEYESNRMWRWTTRVFYPKVDLIVCQTDAMLLDLADSFCVDRRRLIRIYNPVDRRAIEEAAAGFSPYIGDGPHLVCGGRLHPSKGFDLLLRAIGILKGRAITAQLTVLGEGEEEAALRRLAQDLDIASSVHFLGFQSNPFVYYRYADAFVLSSRYEGLSNAMLEAASLATPIVAVDIPGGGVTEVLRGSNAAWIAPRPDAESIANAIAECIRELPRVRTSLVVHPLIADMDCGKIARQYEEAFVRCLPT